MNPLTASQFTELEKELIDEFLLGFNENIEEVQTALLHLDKDASPAHIHELFRSVHSLKGNCKMVFLDVFVTAIHELEEIVQEMRAGERNYDSDYGEFLGNALHILETLMAQIVRQGEADGDLYQRLLSHTQAVAQSKHPEHALLIHDPSTEKNSPASDESKIRKAMDSLFELVGQSDLDLFLHLATQLDRSNLFRKDRTSKELAMCQAINEKLQQPADSEQLRAAVMLHDLGMAFVPPSILSKAESLREEERLLIHAHVTTGAKIAVQLPGWQAAADMVLHHHEKYDGTGYPHQLKAEQIPLGARIIAVSDTFFAVTNERPDRSYKKNLFSAVTLINNESGEQFDPACVEAFNLAVRELYINK